MIIVIKISHNLFIPSFYIFFDDFSKKFKFKFGKIKRIKIYFYYKHIFLIKNNYIY